MTTIILVFGGVRIWDVLLSSLFMGICCGMRLYETLFMCVC